MQGKTLVSCGLHYQSITLSALFEILNNCSYLFREIGFHSMRFKRKHLEKKGHRNSSSKHEKGSVRKDD